MDNSDCLNNLDRCRSACCKHIALPMDENVYWQHKQYWDLHRVRLLPGGVALVYNRCLALQDDGTCRLHAQARKPEICRRAYAELARGLVWYGSCVYRDKAGPGAMIVEDL